MSNEPHYGVFAEEGQNTNYIYLVGITLDKEIELVPNVRLVPVTSFPKPDDMIDCIMRYGSGDEYTLGLLISTLRLVTAQLVITADSAEQLAIDTWNAQTVCVHISAMLNYELAWYFQAEKSADAFDAKTKVSLINPIMRKVPSKLNVIDEQQCKYLVDNMSIALDLDDHKRFSNATNALWTYQITPNSAIQLSIIWSGIESMFLIERGIKTNLSKAISRFLVGDDSLFDAVRDLYESRCKAVHEYKNAERKIVSDSVNLLHRLIIRCIEVNSLPNVDELLKENKR